MDDTVNYTATTQYLNDVHWNRPLIENIMFSNELFGNYVLNSAAQEVAATQSITNYYSTTSDHVPVSVSFQFSTLDNPEFAATSLQPLTLYPNPVNNELQFDGTVLEEAVVTIYDYTGRPIHFEKPSSNSIKVSELPSGIYILKVGGRFGRFVKK